MIDHTDQSSTVWYAIPINNTSGTQDQVDRWCTESFGQGMIGLKQPPDLLRPGPDEFRWALIHGRVFFRYREDMLMFSLRWS